MEHLCCCCAAYVADVPLLYSPSDCVLLVEAYANSCGWLRFGIGTCLEAGSGGSCRALDMLLAAHVVPQPVNAIHLHLARLHMHTTAIPISMFSITCLSS